MHIQMSNLRKRIETLSTTTTSLKAIELCNEALSKMTEYTTKFTLTPHVLQQVEYTVGGALVEGLELTTDKDSIVMDFIVSEKRIVAINTLGVKQAITAVKNTDLYNHPSLRYVAENLSRFENLPEYTTAHTVLEQLNYFSFDPTILEHVNNLSENIKKYSEDIKIYNAIKAIKESASSFLYSSFSGLLENYLNKRTEVTRSLLLENLNKFVYDPNIKNLYNVVSESSNNLVITSTANTAIVENIYSPVYITESSEYFNVHGKYFGKSGSNVFELTESEINELPSDFKFVSEFIQRPNVKVNESYIKLYGKDKVVTILEDASGNPSLKINDRAITFSEFQKVYLNAGVFSKSEITEMAEIAKVLENWDTIMNLDFAKTISSKLVPNQRVDVFMIGESISINKVNPIMNENTFHSGITATAGRNLVLEFMNYDLGNTFTSVLPAEEAKIKTLIEKKGEYLFAIKGLEDKKNLLENHTNPAIRKSLEVRELVDAISEEISNLKAEYFEVQNAINAITKIEEGIGFSAGDTAELAKKKL